MSLYLKYRPLDFQNLVWQEFIKNTLQTSIVTNKTVWAYLFCWPRWTGKTSTARIFAKTINCNNQINWNPCLNCEICNDFLDEKLIDIIEIDAASHTWVDNIRELIEKTQFKPTKTKYKVYIIDEVHMLSKWAFNALLKILEEPPEYIKFILATTETHKVPETIISRCQRYDFNKINTEDIKNRLNHIAKNEDINIDELSLEYIVKNSGWWLRNAISLFEQFIINSQIKYENIISSLWLVDEELFEDFLNKLINKDKQIIYDFEKIIEQWKNIKLFFKDLIFFTKNIALIELKKANNISKLIKILEILEETIIKTKNSIDENTTFLIWILKIISDSDNNNYEIKTTIKENIENKIIKEDKKEIPQKKEENISEIDVNNIFWDDIVEKKESKNNFNLEDFINDLKKSWAKWWLTMALRWTEFNFNWDTLEINTKTKIAKSQLLDTTNLKLIKDTLEQKWYWEVKVIVN